MIHHRQESEVRRFDIFKLIVLLVLIALLLWFWLSPPAFVQGPDEMAEDTAVASQTDTGSESEAAPDSAAEAEDETMPEIDAPELDSPVLTAGLEAGSVTLNGSGTPGSTVRVIVDGAEVGTADVGADGRWAFDLDLAEGSRTLALEALAADGSVATSVDFPAFDVVAPAVMLDIPTLNLPEENLFAGAIGLNGTGTPGSEVGLVIDDELVGTATVGDDGTWSFTTELAAGNHGIHVQAIDADGNVAGESEGFGLPLAELTRPEFDQTGFEFTPGVVDFSGVGTPGTTIEVLANGEVVGTAVVADDGTWALPATLDAGDYDLSLRMVAADGTLLAEAEGVSTSVAVAESESAADFVLPTFDLPEADLAGGEVTLAGSGTPGTEIEIVLNGEVVGTAVVADDGTWRFPTTLPAGEYELALRTVDGSGTAVESDPFSFSLAAVEAPAADAAEGTAATDTTATLPADYCKDAEPGIDQGDTYIVGVCEWLTKIANRLGIEYPALIGVNPQIDNPNLIYPGQVINLPPR